MMYQGWKAQGRLEPMETKRVNVAKPGRRPGWLDSMLGSGSSRAVAQTFGPSTALRPSSSTGPSARLRPGSPADLRTVPRVTLRVQALRSNDDITQPTSKRRKGVLRLVALVLAFSWVMVKTKPWQQLPKLESKKAVEPSPEAAPLGPVVDAKGRAMALWRHENGLWYLVNAAGQLRKATDLEAAARIDLPQVAGVKAKAVQTGSARNAARMLVLDLQPGLLSQLLPLSFEIAPEIGWVSFAAGGEVSLRTQGGATVLLGTDNFREKEARLSAVLADLAARHKRAAGVDLRFKDSAVVRLASR